MAQRLAAPIRRLIPVPLRRPDRRKEDEFVIVANGMLGYGFREQSLQTRSPQARPPQRMQGRATQAPTTQVLLRSPATMATKRSSTAGQRADAGVLSSSARSVELAATCAPTPRPCSGSYDEIVRRSVVVVRPVDRQTVREARCLNEQTFETESPLSLTTLTCRAHRCANGL